MCPNPKAKKILPRISLFHFLLPFKRRKLFLGGRWISKPEIPHVGGVCGRNLTRLKQMPQGSLD